MVQPADTPVPQSATKDLHHIGKLLLTFRPTEGGRVSLPEHTVG